MVQRKTASAGMSKTDRFLQITMAALGAVLLLVSLAVIARGALAGSRDAFIEVTEVKREFVGGRSRIRLEAVNRGDVAAASIIVTGSAPSGQIATTTLDYVPGQSRRAATLSFAGDLADTPVKLEATGWIDP